MAKVQITCITKSQPQGGHEHITHAGNPKGPWKWSVEKIIDSIDSKTNTFYVRNARGDEAYVGVVRPSGRRPYIRTYADGVWTDNLLSLTACSLP
ncbi:DUF3892 domain-containing protein [Hydrogenophaga flava]|uniref:DUF3892 domain-containing protein n=1 Tax=Hydrogenophaga flava TaxID=65657 RepID=UPI000A009C2A|nr:DUF3892 domain-containing protein [Hydrogenophaga flava]